MTIPIEILAQHMAVLGKTGSGKTSTAKLAIEQVVAEGARVCVLDPIKSDWWGLTSSRDGKHAGLPFHILGGPRGHVPLHASAGKAIAEIVASGALPLSIIDMAEFGPGGQAKFFTDFAPTLLRKMRGVVYLVIEEAHLFAPKERSGIGDENLSIHWAKTLATAGRSKGIRLVLVSQRTQALHNALLGSCDTLIAHRLTAPADQEPVLKWLKANTSPAIQELVKAQLASLKTGAAWVCSGEAKIFERLDFPRIKTYDNTATPTGDGDTREIKTAAVDQEKLRAIIGDAVDKAKADDPRELRKQLADVRAQLAKAQQVQPSSQQASAAPRKTVEKPILTDADRDLLEKWTAAIAERSKRAAESLAAADSRVDKLVQQAVAEYLNTIRAVSRESAEQLEMMFDRIGIRQILEKVATVSRTQITPTTTQAAAPRSPHARREAPALAQASSSRPARVVSPSGNGAAVEGMTEPQRRILDVVGMLEQRGIEPDRECVAAWIDIHPRGGSYGENLGALRANGYLDGWHLTDAGRATARAMDTGVAAALAPLTEPQRRILKLVLDANGITYTRDTAAEALGIHPRGGSFGENIGRLRTMGLLKPRGDFEATEALFR